MTGYVDVDLIEREIAEAGDSEGNTARYRLLELAFRRAPALVAEVRRLRNALGEAAMEINVAGPVAHRIRVLKREHIELRDDLRIQNERLVGQIRLIKARADLAFQERMDIVDLCDQVLPEPKEQPAQGLCSDDVAENRCTSLRPSDSHYVSLRCICWIGHPGDHKSYMFTWPQEKRA